MTTIAACPTSARSISVTWSISSAMRSSRFATSSAFRSATNELLREGLVLLGVRDLPVVIDVVVELERLGVVHLHGNLLVVLGFAREISVLVAHLVCGDVEEMERQARRALA